jgi:hypothetical protein
MFFPLGNSESAWQPVKFKTDVSTTVQGPPLKVLCDSVRQLTTSITEFVAVMFASVN